MTARIPENVSTCGWSTGASSPSWATRCRRETPTTMMPRAKTTTPNQTRTSSRRSSENPTHSPHALQLFSPRK